MGPTRDKAQTTSTIIRNDAKISSTSSERTGSSTNSGREFSSQEKGDQVAKPLSSHQLRKNNLSSKPEISKNNTDIYKHLVHESSATSDDETIQECRKMMAGRGAALRSLGLYLLFPFFLEHFFCNLVFF